MQRLRGGLVVLVVLGGVLGSAACGIKAAPRPPLPPAGPAGPPGTSQPRSQGDLVNAPPRPSLPPADSGTP
jgi:hypothetical protein